MASDPAFSGAGRSDGQPSAGARQQVVTPSEAVPDLASPISGAARVPLLRRLKWAVALGTIAYMASTTVGLATSPAYTVGNANFKGILVAGHPRGFPVSPRAYHLSHG